MVFPINKKIWTSSYAIYTTGLALLILSLLIYLIEFKNHKSGWTKFFDVFGKNALFIFALSNIVVKLSNIIRIPNGVNTNTGKQNYTSMFGWFYEHVCKLIFPSEPKIGSLLYALCFIALMWFFAWWMDKKKIYIKV
jgi:predicted acyltransferase